MTRTPWFLGCLATMTLELACAGAPPDEGAAEVTANVLIASPDVRCLVVKAVGATTVTTQADVQGEGASTLALAGLPAGAVTFTASAFSVRCASTGTAAATYVSDPIAATVVVGAPLALTFKMRAVSATGAAAASLDFPMAHGRTTEFSTWSSEPEMASIALGPDGNFWFTQGQSGVGVMSPSGSMVNAFAPINRYTGYPYDADRGAFGPDDNFWFTDINGYIGRLTTSGTMRGFSVPGLASGAMTAGPDGNMWFTDSLNQKVGKITLFGVVTEYAITTPTGYPYSIAAGPDGNVWFTEWSGGKIGRITPAGVITEFAIPTANARPSGIAAGPDGNIWFSEYSGNKIGRLTTAGAFTEFALPMTGVLPMQLTRGPDGNLWVGCAFGALAKVTTAGVVTLYPAGSDSTRGPDGVAAGPDGNIWFTEAPQVGRLAP